MIRVLVQLLLPSTLSYKYVSFHVITQHMKHGHSGESSETHTKEQSVINKQTKEHLETANGQHGGTQPTRNAGFPDKIFHTRVEARIDSVYRAGHQGQASKKNFTFIFPSDWGRWVRTRSE